jgi:hypothetical protein
MCARRDRASWPGGVAGQSARSITAAGQPSWRQPSWRQPRCRPAASQASRVAGHSPGVALLYTSAPQRGNRATPGGWPAWRSHWLKLTPMRATPGGWPASRAHGLQGTLLRVGPPLYDCSARHWRAEFVCASFVSDSYLYSGEVLSFRIGHAIIPDGRNVFLATGSLAFPL